MAHTYRHLFGTPTTGLRFFTFYGPWGRRDLALFLFTRAILDGKPVDVFKHGKLQRDFTYIDDIVEGVVRVLNRAPQANPRFDTAEPDPAHSWAPYQLLNIGNQRAGGSAGAQYASQLPADAAGDVPATFADTTLLTEWTRHKPGTPIRQGIGRLVTWYRRLY